MLKNSITNNNIDEMPKMRLDRPLKKFDQLARRLLATSLLAAAALPAHALVINTTFDGGYNAEQKATVGSAISYVESLITNNVTFTIDFKTAVSGLGASNQAMFWRSYSTVVAQLNANRTSANDYLAMSHVAAGAADPATGKSDIWYTYAQCVVLGFGCSTQGTTKTISLNLSKVDSNRSNGIDAGKYDMYAVALHEIDEFLGVGGPASTVGSGRVVLGIEDLFRYTAAGARSFTTVGDDAYFSIDGGATDLARFNQHAGGDYADWWSTGPHTSSAQDAFGTPGVAYAYNSAELTALDVVGWNLAPARVPEPSTLMLMVPVLLGLGWRGRAGKKPA